jgi:hypothetical protein
MLADFEIYNHINPVLFENKKKYLPHPLLSPAPRRAGDDQSIFLQTPPTRGRAYPALAGVLGRNKKEKKLSLEGTAFKNLFNFSL